MPGRKLPELDLGSHNGKLRSMSMAELTEWLQAEKAVWQWVGELPRNDPTALVLHQHLAKQWREIEGSLTRASAETDLTDARLNDVAHSFQVVYGQNRVIRSSSPRGAFLLERAKVDQAVAAAAMSFFIGLKVQVNSAKALEGALRAVQFDSGVDSNIEHERHALSALRSEWQGVFGDHETEMARLVGEAEALVIKTGEKENTRREQFDKFMDEARSEKDAIEKAYKEHMALKAPVEYWSEKADDHRDRAKWLGGAVAAAFTLGGFALFTGVQTFLIEPDAEPGSWKLAVIAVFTALGIWVIQILVRLLLSDLHQAADARERVTMAKTFLSMMSEGKIDGEAGRSVVLQALFRGTQTGLVRDEVAPPTVIGMINKTLKG